MKQSMNIQHLQKKYKITSSPLKQVSEYFWSPSPLDHPPTAGLEITNFLAEAS